MSNSGYCSLIVLGDNLDLDLIEERLKIKASEKWKKGEIFNNIVEKLDRDFIRFDEKMNGKYNPDKTLTALVDKLKDKELFLKNLSKEACVYMKCYVQSDYAQIYYTISSETINKISQLDIDLDISILSWGGVKDNKKKKKRKKK